MTTIPKPGSISFADRVTKSVPFKWGCGSTPRTAKLRDQLHWKASIVKDWINVSLGLGKMEFRQGIRVDLDRARLVTQAFRETEGQPRVLQYARMVEKLCDEMPIFIKEGELIVGDPNGTPDEVRWYPESNSALRWGYRGYPFGSTFINCRNWAIKSMRPRVDTG